MTLGIQQSTHFDWTTSDPTLTGVTAGHLLILAVGQRGIVGSGFHDFSGQGYTAHPDGGAKAFQNDGCKMWYKTAVGSDTLTIASDASIAGWWAELDGGATVNGHATAQDDHSGGNQTASPTTAGVTAANGDFCVACCTTGTDGGWGSQSYTPPAGWTERLDTDNPTDHPDFGVFTKVSAGASENCAPTCTSSGWWTAQILTFSPSGGGGSSGRSASIITGFRRLWSLDPRGILVPDRRLVLRGAAA
jgi:hypothetical protein